MNQHAKRRYQASLAALPVEPDEDTPQAPPRSGPGVGLRKNLSLTAAIEI